MKRLKRRLKIKAMMLNKTNKEHGQKRNRSGKSPYMGFFLYSFQYNSLIIVNDLLPNRIYNDYVEL
jgi:hypothetical protein